jgi:hypothetical protein
LGELYIYALPFLDKTEQEKDKPYENKLCGRSFSRICKHHEIAFAFGKSKSKVAIFSISAIICQLAYKIP